MRIYFLTHINIKLYFLICLIFEDSILTFLINIKKNFLNSYLCKTYFITISYKCKNYKFLNFKFYFYYYYRKKLFFLILRSILLIVNL